MDVDQYFQDGFLRRDWQTIDEGTVRLAVIGLGGFARNRALPSIRDTQFCETTVLVSGSPDKAADLADEFGADRIVDYEGFHGGEAADLYDAVYVATPPSTHLKYAETAARLGKHVLCEKPLAADPQAGQQMVDVCADAGVVLMTAYRLRTEPAVRRMRDAIRDGVVGDPVQVEGGFSSQLLEAVGPDTWRLDPDVAGGGALMDLGVYPLHTSRFLLDDDPVSVHAETTSTGPPFDRVDEHGVMLLRFPDGTTATCSASFDAQPDDHVRVLGTEGKIEIRSPFGGAVSQEVLVQRGSAQTRYTGEAVDEVREEFDYFAHCVLAGSACESTGAEGLADLQIISAAYEAADSGQSVTIGDASG